MRESFLLIKAMRECRTDPLRSTSEPDSAGAGDFLRGPADRDPDLDTVFDALGSRRRRIILHHLRSREDEWVSLADLVDRVTAWESELDASQSVSEEAIELDLVHRHLPKLDASGVIAYEGERDRAAYHGSDRIGRFLDLTLREGPLP